MLCEHDVLSEIIPNRLFLTSWEVAKNDAILTEYNIDIIVSIIDFEPFKYSKSKVLKRKQLVHYFAKDHDDFDIQQYFELFYRLMEDNPGKRVLVHCLVGMSRSASLVISYLVRKNPSIDFYDHLYYVKEIRECIDPNEGFKKQLGDYRRMLIEKEK